MDFNTKQLFNSCYMLDEKHPYRDLGGEMRRELGREAKRTRDDGPPTDFFDCFAVDSDPIRNGLFTGNTVWSLFTRQYVSVQYSCLTA